MKKKKFEKRLVSCLLAAVVMISPIAEGLFSMNVFAEPATDVRVKETNDGGNEERAEESANEDVSEENSDRQSPEQDITAEETSSEETISEDGHETEKITFEAILESGMLVKVNADADSIPCDPGEVSLEVEQISSKRAEKLINREVSEYDLKDGVRRETLLYDIRLIHEGREIEPAGEVELVFADFPKELSIGEDVQVFHVEENVFGMPRSAEDMMAEKIDETAVLTTDHFSIYGVTWTVDFSYRELDFSIIGESSILLSDLFSQLEIEDRVTDVEKVEFSDPTLIRIDETARDWRLTSLKAFKTEEELTITFKNGDVLVINVTDADPQNITSASQLKTFIENAPTDGVQTGEEYVLKLSATFSIYQKITIPSGAKIHITSDQVRIVKFGINFPIFTVSEGAELTLGENVSYQADGRGNSSLTAQGGLARVYGILNINAKNSSSGSTLAAIIDYAAGAAGDAPVVASGANAVINFNAGRIQGKEYDKDNAAAAFLLESGAKLTIKEGAEIRFNKSSAKNAAPIIAKGAGTLVEMRGGHITSNTYSGTDSTGGILVTNGASFKMSGGTISRCAGRRGGAVRVGSWNAADDIASFEFSGGTIKECVANNGGGVAVIPRSDMRISSGAEIDYCHAYKWDANKSEPWSMIKYSEGDGTPDRTTRTTLLRLYGGNGGGIHVWGFGPNNQGYNESTREARLAGRQNYKAAFHMEGGIIKSCGARAGGGVYAGSDDCYFESGDITSCIAAYMGGGIACPDRVKTTFGSTGTKVAFYENHAARDGGGIWLCPTGIFLGGQGGNSDLIMWNNTAGRKGKDFFKSNPELNEQASRADADYTLGHGKRSSLVYEVPHLLPDGTAFHWKNEYTNGDFPDEALKFGTLSMALTNPLTVASPTESGASVKTQAEQADLRIFKNYSYNVGGGLQSDSMVLFDATYYDFDDSVQKSAYVTREGRTTDITGSMAEHEEVFVGEEITYKIVYTAKQSGQLEIEDVIPDGLSYIANSETSPTGSTFTIDGQNAKWSDVPATRNQDVEISFKVKVDSIPNVAGSKRIKTRVYHNQAKATLTYLKTDPTGNPIQETVTSDPEFSNFTYNYWDAHMVYLKVSKMFDAGVPDDPEILELGVHTGGNNDYYTDIKMLVLDKNSGEPIIFERADLTVGSTQNTNSTSTEYGVISFRLYHGESLMMDCIEKGSTVKLWEKNVMDFPFKVNCTAKTYNRTIFAKDYKLPGADQNSQLKPGESTPEDAFEVRDIEDTEVLFTNKTSTVTVTKELPDGVESDELFKFRLQNARQVGQSVHDFHDYHIKAPEGRRSEVSDDGIRVDFELKAGESIVFYGLYDNERENSDRVEIYELNAYGWSPKWTYYDHTNGYDADGRTVAGNDTGTIYASSADLNWGNHDFGAHEYVFVNRPLNADYAFYKRNEYGETSFGNESIGFKAYSDTGLSNPLSNERSDLTTQRRSQGLYTNIKMDGYNSISSQLLTALNNGTKVYLKEVAVNSSGSWDRIPYKEPSEDSYLEVTADPSKAGGLNIVGHGDFAAPGMVSLENGYFVVKNKLQRNSLTITKKTVGMNIENPNEEFSFYGYIASRDYAVYQNTHNIDSSRITIPNGVTVNNNVGRDREMFTFKLKAGESITFPDIPELSEVYIEERSIADWSPNNKAYYSQYFENDGEYEVVNSFSKWNQKLTVEKVLQSEKGGTFYFEMSLGNAEEAALDVFDQTGDRRKGLPGGADVDENEIIRFSLTLSPGETSKSIQFTNIPYGSFLSLKEVGSEGYDVSHYKAFEQPADDATGSVGSELLDDNGERYIMAREGEFVAQSHWVRFINSPKKDADLIISKRVLDENGEEDSSVKEPFRFNVKFRDSSGEAWIPGSEILQTVKLTDADGDNKDADVSVTQDGTLEAAVSHGQKLKMTGIPVGCTAELEEINADDYIVSSKTTINGSTQPPIANDGNTASFTLTDDAEVAFTNKAKAAYDLKVGKTTLNGDTSKFGFEVMIKDKNNDQWLPEGDLADVKVIGTDGQSTAEGIVKDRDNGKLTFNLAHGEHIILPNIPRGSEVSVQEIDSGEYVPTYKLEKGIVETGSAESRLMLANKAVVQVDGDKTLLIHNATAETVPSGLRAQRNILTLALIFGIISAFAVVIYIIYREFNKRKRGPTPRGPGCDKVEDGG